MHFVVMFDYETSFDADKYMTYIKGFATSVAFGMEVRGLTLYHAHKKMRNYVVTKTVPVTIVRHKFRQEPVVLARTIR